MLIDPIFLQNSNPCKSRDYFVSLLNILVLHVECKIIANKDVSSETSRFPYHGTQTNNEPA